MHLLTLSNWDGTGVLPRLRIEHGLGQSRTLPPDLSELRSARGRGAESALAAHISSIEASRVRTLLHFSFVLRSA